nr:MAG TPA: hypothetical protein [Caudoviricetes sp.]
MLYFLCKTYYILQVKHRQGIFHISFKNSVIY